MVEGQQGAARQPHHGLSVVAASTIAAARLHARVVDQDVTLHAGNAPTESVALIAASRERMVDALRRHAWMGP